MRFKLVAGHHIGPDYDMKPNKEGKYPSRYYRAGEQGNDVVEDEADLEKKHGREKFVRLDDNRRRSRDQERVTEAMRRSPQVQQAEEGPQQDRIREATREEKAKEAGQPVSESKQHAVVVKPGDGKDFAESGGVAGSATEVATQINPSTMPGKHEPREKFQAPTLPTGMKIPQSKEEYFSVLDKMSHAELKTLATQEGLAPGNKNRADLLKMLKEDAESDD